MKKMKRKITLFAMLSVLALSSVGAFASCQQTVNYDVLPEEGLYTYDFNEPFTAKPDAYMQLDGKFEEELWQNKNWLEASNRDTSMRATTAFTSEGLYIGLEAFDTNITWIGRNNFNETGVEKTNSFFIIQVIKSGQSTTNDRMKDLKLFMDCQAICSHRERKVAAGSNVVGEVNSGATTSLSGEIFVPWNELGYTESEVNEYGYPEDLQMDVKYLRVFDGASGNNFTVKSSPLQAYTFTSYPYYNENGLVGTYDCEEFGNAIGGAPATDKWEIEKDENGKVTKLTTTVDRAQTIFFRQDADGNTKSSASDFVLETRVKILPLGSNSVPVCGLWIGSYLVTGIRGDYIKQDKIFLQNSKSISDAQWMGEPQDFTLKNLVESNYTKDYVDLRIVKCGTEIYYFYNDTFYKVETRENFAGAIPVGLFANGRAEFTNFRFVDYSENAEALTEYLSEYVHFVSVQKPSSKGSISSETVAVKKGESITLNVKTGLECYLSEFTINGESKYSELENGLNPETGEYVFTPTEDITIAYKFEYLDSKDLENVSILVNDSNGKALSNAEYRITSNSSLIYYVGTTNDRGYINVLLPKTGFAVGSTTLDGNYGLYLEAVGQKPKKASFELPCNEMLEIQMNKVGYGSLTINGLPTKDVTGTPLYDIDNDVYYVNSGNVVQYFVDLVSTKENEYNYVVDATIDVYPIKEGGMLDDSVNGVTGIIISSGNEESIVIKQTSYSWEQDRICLQLGTGTNETELSISGFNHSLGKTGGQINITLARYSNAIYVFDAEGELGFYLDKDGLHLVGEHQLKSSQEYRLEGVNNKLKAFFARGEENAVGMVNFDNVKAVWTSVVMNKGTEAVQDKLALSSVDFETETEDYSATIDGVKVGEKYVSGYPVEITFDKKNNRYPIAITITYENGYSERFEGLIKDGKIKFSFVLSDDCSIAVTEYVEEKTYSGRIQGATEKATLELYDASGALIKTSSNLFDKNGNYSVTLIEADYSAIVMDAGKAVFFDDFSNEANGVLVNAISITGKTYEQRKNSADGEWTFNTSAGAMVTQNYENYAPTGNYSVEFSISGNSARGQNGNAGVDILSANKKGYVRLIFGTDCNNGNGAYLLISDGTTETKTGIILQKDGEDYSVGRFNSSNMSVNVKVVRVDNVITIFAAKDTNAYTELLRIDENGISACDNGYTYLNHGRTSLNLASYFADKASALVSWTTGANTFRTFHYSSNAYAYTCAMSESEINYLTGSIVGATDGEAKVNLYNANGNLLTAYKVTVANGKYTVFTDETTMSNVKKAIITQGVKAGCIEDLSVSTDVELTVAYGLNGSTYDQLKDSMDGTFGYTTTADTYTKLGNMTTNGDYEYYFEISASNPNGIDGEAGIVIGSGNYTIRIERLRNKGTSTISIYAFDSSKSPTKTHSAYGLAFSYDGNTNDTTLGYHNSAGLTQRFKLVRTGTKIEIYMANAENDYAHIFTLEKGVGMVIANDNFAITNGKTVESEGMLEAVNAICSEGANNEFWLRSITLTDWQFSVGKI